MCRARNLSTPWESILSANLYKSVVARETDFREQRFHVEEGNEFRLRWFIYGSVKRANDTAQDAISKFNTLRQSAVPTAIVEDLGSKM